MFRDDTAVGQTANGPVITWMAMTTQWCSNVNIMDLSQEYEAITVVQETAGT